MKILVIQTAFLGDFVMTLPLIRRLHDDDPEAAITVAVRPSLAEFAADQPGIREVLPVRKRRGGFARLGHDRETLRRLVAGRFDRVYLAQRSFRSGLYARLTGAPTRVGFRGSPSAWACTTRVPDAPGRHAVDRYRSLAGRTDGSPLDDRPRVRVTERSAVECDALLRGLGVDPRGAFVTLVPGSVWPTKRWTPEGFAAVARWLHARGVAVVVDGSPEERPLCEEVCRRAGGGAVCTAGRTSLPVLAALLAAGRAMVGNDSGAAHLAAAVGTPAVVLYGPTSVEQGMSPLGEVQTVGLPELACRPFGRHGSPACPLGHHACMRDLGPELVIQALRRAWPRLGAEDTPRERLG